MRTINTANSRNEDAKMGRAIVFLMCLLTSISCYARTITVDGDGPADYSTIQDAINDSNNGDTILVSEGHYYENIDFRGKAITVTSVDPNDPNVTKATIIDANSDDIYNIVVSFHSGEGPNSVITGFTITGGQALYGGGICCWDNCSPTISDCNITGNFATRYGGGIYCRSGSNATISNCTITGNTASDNGGGVYCIGSNPTITNCTISGNDGGGVYCIGGNPTITNCTISGNDGGGVYCGGGNPTITNCTISGNNGGGVRSIAGNPTITNCTISGNNGGGVYCHQSNPTITNCTISGNSASGGGGISCYKSSPTITDCTITGNTASDNGGGVYCDRSNPTITNCTISGNSASGGGGISCYKSSPTITDCTFSGNSANSGGGVSCSQSSPTITDSTISGNTANSGGGIYCNQSSPTITDCTLSGNFANTKGGGIFCYANSSPMIRNCTLSANAAVSLGAGIDCEDNSSPVITNNIICYSSSGCGIYAMYSDPIISYNNVWGNADGDYGGWAWPGVGDISIDPCFADPGHWEDPCNTPGDPNDDVWIEGDYHLKSESGRWDPNSQTWVQDDVTSPCIDAGDPNSDWTAELWPHGKRINMGVYGGAREASMSLSAVGNVADLNSDGIVNLPDYSYMAQGWDVTEVLLREDLDRNGHVDGNDLGMFVAEWLWQE